MVSAILKRATFAALFLLSAKCWGSGIFNPGGSGSGTPGGSNTQIQFNDGNSFNGSTVTWDKNNKIMSFPPSSSSSGVISITSDTVKDSFPVGRSVLSAVPWNNLYRFWDFWNGPSGSESMLGGMGWMNSGASNGFNIYDSAGNQKFFFDVGTGTSTIPGLNVSAVLLANGSPGTTGQVLSSNGGGVNTWINQTGTGLAYAIEPTTVTLTFGKGIGFTGNWQSGDYTATLNDSVILSSSTAGTTRYVTLPALVTTSSQTITVVKVDLSRGPVVARVGIGSGDLIAGTTQQLWMYAPGQSVQLYGSKATGSWWPQGAVPKTPPTIGNVGNDPNSAAVVTASTTYCHAEYVPDFTTMLGMEFNVATSAGGSLVQVSAYDNYGVLVGTSDYTPMPGTGIIYKTFINPVYLQPGTVWLCFGTNAAVAQISRRSTGANDMGTCSFAVAPPATASKTFPGCTHTSSDYAFVGMIAGGIIP